MRYISLLGLCFVGFGSYASAGQLFVNGSFEIGGSTSVLSGWMVTTDANADASGDSFFSSSDIATPLTGEPTVGPEAGTYYAVSDGFGPGMVALTQAFVVSTVGTSNILSGWIFVNDFDGGSGTGEVDLLAGNANALTTTPIAVLYGPKDTAVVNGNPNGWVQFSVDITSLIAAGQTYQIRILDNQPVNPNAGPFNIGADNFSLISTSTAPAPEPAMFLPVALLSGFMLRRARRTARR